MTGNITGCLPGGCVRVHHLADIHRHHSHALDTAPEVDPEDVVAVDQDYRCAVCGAELTMTAVNVSDDNPPRHCREDMIPIWRPA